VQNRTISKRQGKKVQLSLIQIQGFFFIDSQISRG